MSQVVLEATYVYYDEDDELINLKFYKDTDTLKIKMYLYDKEEEKPIVMGYVPESIEDGVDYFNNLMEVKLTKMSSNPSTEDNSSIPSSQEGHEGDDEEEPESNDKSEIEDSFSVIPFDVNNSPSLIDAALLSDIIVTSLEHSIYADDLIIKPNEDGNLEVSFRSSIAVIVVGIKQK